MTSLAMPASDVFAAFGVESSAPVRMSGGRGLTWRAGDIVLRPHDGAEESAWKAQVLADIGSHSGFRTARPIRTVDGSWAYGTWEAWEWLPGAADERRVVDVIRAGEAFHAAISALARPAFIDASEDAWIQADRMAWEEAALPRATLLDRLAAEFRSVRSPSQVIHGDLLGNVLFDPEKAPAIIDWAPYWRPAGLGAAIAAVDAACWHDWPSDRLAELGSAVPEWRQLLVRALAFRIATLHNLDRWSAELEQRHAPIVDALIALETAR